MTDEELRKKIYMIVCGNGLEVHNQEGLTHDISDILFDFLTLLKEEMLDEIKRRLK